LVKHTYGDAVGAPLGQSAVGGSLSRLRARKSQRGTTVLVVVMVTTLITAIGIFAVRNVSQIDQAIGFSRQGSQTLAVAELGTTAALAQIAVRGAGYYADLMDRGNKCLANAEYRDDTSRSCFRMGQNEIEATTTTTGGESLFAVPDHDASETGSFGPLSDSTGFVSIEMTEKYKTTDPVPGARIDDASYVRVTLTSTGMVRPSAPGADECTTTARVASKKVVRAHTIIGPLQSPSQSQ